MLIGGMLGDIIGMIIFIVASVLCGMAPTAGWLIAGRFFDTQGSYMPVWIIGILLAVAAAFIHLPISNQPVITNAPQSAAAD